MAERDFPEVMDTALAAEFLMVNIEKMRAMARDGDVPSHKIPGGRMYRFVKSELLEWLLAQPGHTSETVEPQAR